jgi:hypothetical protein
VNIVHVLYILYENRIMKLVEIVLKKGERRNVGGKMNG